MTTFDIADPFARHLMERYLSHRQQDLSNMRAALASGDLNEIRLSGHNMRGSGGAYGLNRISELGERLEYAAIRHDQDEIASLIDALETFVRDLNIS